VVGLRGVAVSADPSLAAGVPLADPALRASVAAGLARVEELLHEQLRSEFAFLTETSRHLVDAGGKRFRPLFTLLAAQIGPEPESPAVPVAAASVELVHLATLYHDDVMDEATMRRGAVSANARWDNSVAILTGDFLFAHAARLVADLGLDAVRTITDTFAELVTGQMRETLGPGEGDPVAHYLRVIAEKTGSLIATAGRYGGTFSGASEAHVAALARYGELVGAAFQISDDIIDIASPSTYSGKQPGTDLREGVRTLPVLYTLEGLDPADPLHALLSGPLTDDRALATALTALRASPGMERARQTLRDYCARARAELESLPDGPARAALDTLAVALVDRTG
jgi:heptaprenyl diphosphate synthase